MFDIVHAADLSCELGKLVEACTARNVVDCFMHFMHIPNGMVQPLQPIGQWRRINGSVASQIGSLQKCGASELVLLQMSISSENHSSISMSMVINLMARRGAMTKAISMGSNTTYLKNDINAYLAAMRLCHDAANDFN